MELFLDTFGRRRVQSLLLLYLFVLKAAADCPKPQRGENIVLTNEALLMNDFPEGIEVTLECANGYERESGSGVTTCIDDKWSEPDLTCQKKDCGPPKPQPNMSFDTSGGTLFGAVVRVTCDKGFRVTGSSYKTCYASGWIGKARCHIVSCGKPVDVTNGRHTWTSQENPKYGETFQYKCDEGYALVGKNVIRCSETGAYDSVPPACEGVTTEDALTTKTPPPPTQEDITSPAATPSVHADKSVKTRARATVPPSPPGGTDVLTAEGRATASSVTSATPSSFQGKHNGTVDTNSDIGYTSVIVSVICVSLAVCIVAIFSHKYLLKRKGSGNGTVPIY